jgi:hypothetical protein
MLATQEAEIERITIRDQPEQKVQETISQPIILGSGGVHLSFQLGGKCK